MAQIVNSYKATAAISPRARHEVVTEIWGHTAHSTQHMMNKLQGFLTTLVVALSIACIALIVTVAKFNQTQENNPLVTIAHKERQTSNNEPELEIIAINPEPEPESEPEPETPLKEWERNVRLPEHLIPLHYDLYLHPDLATGLFTGQETVFLSLSAV